MKRYFSEERGNIAVLFAFVFIVLVGMAAMATDIGLLAIKRARLMEIGQIMRDARFEQSQLIWEADDPAQKFDEIVREYGIKNGLRDDQIQTEYTTVENSRTRRECKVVMKFTDTYKCTTLRLFGLNEVPIKVTINGSAYEQNSNGVWSPGR
ncbi:putative membrane protein [[Clostridium] cellulosi]|uniref:Putative membrane protein n=1 Tax=[Clostridium] cellulosi TaxID=29343 RepID=A0A078KQR4_9FIRM|nr:MAG: hypothetical protein DIU81_08480 [[Clostridium] cellulosi]CDZ23480.1 putative membrane protein [[Clostridium] cellulosi]